MNVREGGAAADARAVQLQALTCLINHKKIREFEPVLRKLSTSTVVYTATLKSWERAYEVETNNFCTPPVASEQPAAQLLIFPP